MLFLGQVGWYARVTFLSSLVALNALPHLRKKNLSGKRATLKKAQFIFFLLLLCYRGLQKLLFKRKAPPTLEALRSHFNTAYSSPVKESSFVNRDGVVIAYRTIGTGKKVVLAAAGLGCSAVFAVPILNSIHEESTFVEHTLVTWDYRGLFGSTEGSECLQTTLFSVRDQALDAAELLDVLGHRQVDAIIGYSTGVQVALEFAALYPSRVGRLILLNGTWGQLIGSVLQPLFRLPVLSAWIHRLLELARTALKDHKTLWLFLQTSIKVGMTTFRYLVLKPWSFLTGSNYEWHAANYIFEFFHNKSHTVNYLKYPAALEAHSCYHVLEEIQQPTLIVTGMLDVLTPAYASYEMAYLMPNAELCCKLFGTHFVLLEYPEEAGERIKEFLARRTTQPRVREPFGVGLAKRVAYR